MGVAAFKVKGREASRPPCSDRSFCVMSRVMENSIHHTALLDRMLAAWQEVGWGEMVIHLECLFDVHLDAERLAKAVELTLLAEPLLGSRFVEDGKRAWFEALAPEEWRPLLVTESAEEYRAFVSAPFRHKEEQGLSAALLRQAGGDCLMFRVSHLVADAAATREAVAEVAFIYRRLKQYPEWRPERSGGGRRGLAQLTRRLTWGDRLAILRNHLRAGWRHLGGVRRVDLPKADPLPLGWVIRHVPANRVATIVAWGKQRSATINDLFVAAFMRSIAGNDRSGLGGSHRLRTTVDLRRYLPDKAAGGVCNFSAFELIDAGSEPFASYPDAVARVVAYTSQAKKNFVGLSDFPSIPLLKRFTFRGLLAIFRRMGAAHGRRRTFPNTLTNMGQIAPHVVDFSVAPKAAYLLAPPIYPPAFGGGLSGFGGSITLSFGVPAQVKGEVERVVDMAIAELPH